MSRKEWADLFNAAVANERNSFAREHQVEAAIQDGKLVYRGLCRGGYMVRLTFREALSFLHGADMRALIGVRG